jgi:hypothetical protein
MHRTSFMDRPNSHSHFMEFQFMIMYRNVMKYFPSILCLLFSSSTYAHQFFQCSVLGNDLSEVMVIDLKNKNSGTIFLSSNDENSQNEKSIFEFELEKVENKIHFYKLTSSYLQGYIVIPSHVLGKSTNGISLEVGFSPYNFTLSCFSRIYHD